MKADKEKIIAEMLSELAKGSKYSYVLSVNVSKWQLQERTFVRYWNVAKAKHSERVEVASAISDKAYIETFVKAVVEGAIKSQIERREILSRIADLSIDESKNINHIIKAIGELNKMDLIFAEKSGDDDIELILPEIPQI